MPVHVEPFFGFESSGRGPNFDFDKTDLPRTAHFILFCKVQVPVKASELTLKFDPNEV